MNSEDDLSDPISLGGQSFDALEREDQLAATLARDITALLRQPRGLLTCASAIDALAWCIGDIILEDAPYHNPKAISLGGDKLVRYARAITRRRITEAVELARMVRKTPGL